MIMMKGGGGVWMMVRVGKHGLMQAQRFINKGEEDSGDENNFVNVFFFHVCRGVMICNDYVNILLHFICYINLYNSIYSYK